MWYNGLMNIKLPLVLALAVLALPLRAQSPESIKTVSLRAFTELSAFKPDARKEASRVAPAREILVSVQGARNARMVGEVELSGHGHIPSQNQGVYMLLSGSMDVADENGRVLARNVQVAYSGLLQVSGSYVSGYAHPQVYAPLYRDGRYIGSVKLSGPVHVSGHASGTWARVSGRGRLWGYAVLQD